jgi:hypothetical protein
MKTSYSNRYYNHTTTEDYKEYGQPTYEKDNEELFLDNPLHAY